MKFFCFRPGYFLLFILLLLVEILIAVFVKDNFVRPYIGDFLVVILLYCFARAFINFSKKKTAAVVLIFSFLVELVQYLQIIKYTPLYKYAIARVVIGTSFEWMDLLAYSAGILFTLLSEAIIKNWKYR